MNNDIENPNSEYWKQKYLKYKAKYMNIYTNTGGRSHHSNHSQGRHSYNPYFQQQYMQRPQMMPMMIEVKPKDDDSLIIEDSPKMMVPMGPFGPMLPTMGPMGIGMGPMGPMGVGPMGPFMITPKTKTTKVKSNSIYNFLNFYMKQTNSIYLRLFDINNDILVATATNTTYLKIQIRINENDYVKQIKDGLRAIGITTISDSIIEDQNTYQIENSKVYLKTQLHAAPPANYTFVDPLNVVNH